MCVHTMQDGSTDQLNPLDAIGNYNATSNKLVHWPLMGGLLHLVQRGGAWAGWVILLLALSIMFLRIHLFLPHVPY